MQRKKGFTLVELLVALVCAALVLSMITAAVIFLTRMNNGVTTEGKTLFQLQTVKEFVQKNAETDLAIPFEDLNENYLVKDGKVIHQIWGKGEGGFVVTQSQVLVSDSLIESVTFDPSRDFKTAQVIKCTITYDKGQTFVFVAYTQTTPSTPTP